MTTTTTHQPIEFKNFVQIELVPGFKLRLMVHSIFPNHGEYDEIYLMKEDGTEFTNHTTHIRHRGGEFIMITETETSIDCVKLQPSELVFSD